MTVDVERVREEARGYVFSVRFDSPDVGQRLARLAKAYLALCDELGRTREQLREAREALALLGDGKWWHVDVDVNGEYMTRDVRHHHDAIRVANEALARLSEATP